MINVRIKAVAIDAAGNEQEIEVETFVSCLSRLADRKVVGHVDGLGDFVFVEKGTFATFPEPVRRAEDVSE